jgi:hypothetical protein
MGIAVVLIALIVRRSHFWAAQRFEAVGRVGRETCSLRTPVGRLMRLVMPSRAATGPFLVVQLFFEKRKPGGSLAGKDSSDASSTTSQSGRSARAFPAGRRLPPRVRAALPKLDCSLFSFSRDPLGVPRVLEAAGRLDVLARITYRALVDPATGSIPRNRRRCRKRG